MSLENCTSCVPFLWPRIAGASFSAGKWRVLRGCERKREWNAKWKATFALRLRLTFRQELRKRNLSPFLLQFWGKVCDHRRQWNLRLMASTNVTLRPNSVATAAQPLVRFTSTLAMNCTEELQQLIVPSLPRIFAFVVARQQIATAALGV